MANIKILRINLATFTSHYEDIPASWQRLGGRGLIARIALDEIPPTCDPLGQKNKLIWTSGLLVGHMLSSCDRISIGGKSPLTGGIKESNAGGTTGLQLSALGIKALIIENQPSQPDLGALHISKDGVRFDDANELTGLGVYQASARLLKNMVIKWHYP